MARSKLHGYPDDALRWVIEQVNREEATRPLTGHERQRRLDATAILAKRARNRAKRAAGQGEVRTGLT